MDIEKYAFYDQYSKFILIHVIAAQSLHGHTVTHKLTLQTIQKQLWISVSAIMRHNNQNQIKCHLLRLNLMGIAGQNVVPRS